MAPVTWDRMYREECYYLWELSRVSPVCDPAVQAFEMEKKDERK